ncbi:hypothetical protein ACQ4M4_20400 [Leptolyngbya sp. AN02str]|uniref:hypothetical protein n=1 Tax=Leptolyngbya sp. AN02str TaxID=3423363 RepID=UPI003D318912
MDRTEAISKEELQQLLIGWGCGQISSKELREWMELNYFPLHLEIAPDEAQHVQRAMHVIMNEFENVASSRYVPENYKAALIISKCD